MSHLNIYVSQNEVLVHKCNFLREIYSPSRGEDLQREPHIKLSQSYKVTKCLIASCRQSATVINEALPPKKGVQMSNI